MKFLSLCFEGVKMDVLKTNQIFMTLIGVCSPPHDTSWYKRVRNISLGLFIQIVFVLGFLSSLIAVMQNKGVNFKNTLVAIYQVVVIFGNFCSMAFGFAFRRRLRQIFTTFQLYYDQSNEKSSKFI